MTPRLRRKLELRTCDDLLERMETLLDADRLRMDAELQRAVGDQIEKLTGSRPRHETALVTPMHDQLLDAMRHLTGFHHEDEEAA